MAGSYSVDDMGHLESGYYWRPRETQGEAERWRRDSMKPGIEQSLPGIEQVRWNTTITTSLCQGYSRSDPVVTSLNPKTRYSSVDLVHVNGERTRTEEPPLSPVRISRD
ncbi:hypothetical protein RRG08_043206 [Elysia crispata]|uniref:Uncharacterized protein n=1 Tax=Elysia crispata TaxID=231223 RepID=A0AAE0ZIG1_9GAST|nr:hypothetical protein RRG08_043206 [Elysia crispata]